MRARVGMLGLVAAVGLSLVGPRWSARGCRAEDDAGVSEPAAAPQDVDTPEPTTAAPPATVAESEPNVNEDDGGDEQAAADPVTADPQPLAADRAVPPDREALDGGRRVRLRLDVTGELFSGAGGDGATVREPVTMSARFDFDEHPGAAGESVRRVYRDATATLDVAGHKTSTVLAADARRLLVARRGTTPSAYLDTGFLTGEEADLLETPFDSLLLDDLPAKGTVRLEERWDVPADLTAGLVAIDTVESGGLTARIAEVVEGRAQVVLEGIVDGAVDGVPTHVTVEGTCTIPVAAAPHDEDAGDADAGDAFLFRGRVSHVAVVVRERRQPSHVAPGFDVEARLVVARGPLAPAEDVPEAAANAARGPAGPAGTITRRRGHGEPGRLWHRDPAGRFDLVHDARWRRVEDGPHGLVLRLVDHGALVGQCSINCLPDAPAAQPPAVADVRRDFERSLSGQVSRIEAADEEERADGLRVVRVEAAGTAGGLSFRWMHYVITGPAGGRASVTFMCEDSLRERFAAADRLLVEGLRVPAGAEGGESAGGTAARPDGGVGPRR